MSWVTEREVRLEREARDVARSATIPSTLSLTPFPPSLSSRLCLPALIVVGDLNAVTQPRDAAGACLVMLAAADDTFVGKPPGAALRIADGLGANARPPPAPLGWPARGALTRAAAAVAEPAVLTVLLERPPAPPLEAAVAVDFPHSAAVLLHAPNAPWRELLRRVRVEGLTAAVELDFQLPLPLTSPPLGTIHHGASHGPDESDSASLARTSVRLHLELMKWRACPAFDIDKVVALRVLIIGAGAVGGAISCTLLGYGVTKQTFVDSGTVGLSNVARQPLFSAADAAHGMAKATAAANSLVASHPGAEAIGIVLDIPTPGRAQRGTDAITAHLSAIATLRELLKTSDVVFLALDTREARWLPAVMAASLPPACAPLVITAGVGFDTAVVVRHGAPHSTLGCFFCAGGDTAPPRDSRAGAPMDEICTVTRPGVVFLVGALAAELAITTLLHPLGAAAPHEAMDAVVFPSPFGAASHVTRAKIRGPSITTTGAPADPFCLTCGPTIQNEIALRGDAFLIDALTYPKTLEMLYSRRDAVDARMTHTDSATLEGGWNAL